MVRKKEVRNSLDKEAWVHRLYNFLVTLSIFCSIGELTCKPFIFCQLYCFWFCWFWKITWFSITPLMSMWFRYEINWRLTGSCIIVLFVSSIQQRIPFEITKSRYSFLSNHLPKNLSQVKFAKISINRRSRTRSRYAMFLCQPFRFQIQQFLLTLHEKYLFPA